MNLTSRLSLKKPQTSDGVSALRTSIGDNADILDAAAFTEADRAQVGLTDADTVRRGKAIIPGTETTTSTSFTYLATPDRVQNVVVPTDGLLFVAYEALIKGTTAFFAQGAIFIGSNQLKNRSPDGTLAPGVNMGAAPGSDWCYLSSFGGGLFISEGTTSPQASSVTTGQAIGQWGDLAPSANVPMFGAVVIDIPAGTYTVGVQFKTAGAGTTSVKERKLRVWTMGF